MFGRYIYVLQFSSSLAHRHGDGFARQHTVIVLNHHRQSMLTLGQIAARQFYHTGGFVIDKLLRFAVQQHSYLLIRREVSAVTGRYPPAKVDVLTHGKLFGQIYRHNGRAVIRLVLHRNAGLNFAHSGHNAAAFIITAGPKNCRTVCRSFNAADVTHYRPFHVVGTHGHLLTLIQTKGSKFHRLTGQR